jgi:predicted nucleic acid-binding protein
MRIVIDASIVVAVLLNEPQKAAIVEFTKGTEVISPTSLPWEVGNAISANVRKKRITHEQAIQAIQDYHKIDVRLVDIDIEESIRISNQYHIYAYDAYVLLCAMIFKAPLFCLDEGMGNLAKLMGIKTIEVV